MATGISPATGSNFGISHQPIDNNPLFKNSMSSSQGGGYPFEFDLPFTPQHTDKDHKDKDLILSLIHFVLGIPSGAANIISAAASTNPSVEKTAQIRAGAAAETETTNQPRTKREKRKARRKERRKNFTEGFRAVGDAFTKVGKAIGGVVKGVGKVLGKAVSHVLPGKLGEWAEKGVNFLAGAVAGSVEAVFNIPSGFAQIMEGDIKGGLLTIARGGLEIAVGIATAGVGNAAMQSGKLMLQAGLKSAGVKAFTSTATKAAATSTQRTFSQLTAQEIVRAGQVKAAGIATGQTIDLVNR